MDTITVTGLCVGLTVLVSLVGLFFTEARKRRLKQRGKALRAAVQAQIDAVLHSKSLSPARFVLERTSAEVHLAPSDLSRLVCWIVLNRLEPLATTTSSLSKDYIEKEITNQVTILTKRIEQLESRLADGASLEKVVSVNAAVLAANVAGLVERLNRLEEKLLTVWDVGMVVFTIFTAFAGLVGLTLAVIKLLLISSPAL